MKLRMMIALGLSVLLAGTGVSVANAGPDNSPQAEIFELDCEEIGLIEVAVTGNGAFSPGHIAGSNALLIPVSIEITGTFTPDVGDPEVFEETSERNAPPDADLITCTFEQSGAEEGGTFEIQGTVVGYVVGDLS